MGGVRMGRVDDPSVQAVVRREGAPTRPAEGARACSRGGLRRGLLVAVGVVCVGLGVIGVVVPVLPTTPFLLLAAACFLRSSDRLHRWLLGNRVFGEYLRRYRDGEGLPWVSKITTLVLLWATLAVSAIVTVPEHLWWVRLLMLVMGIGVTIHILRIKTRRGWSDSRCGHRHGSLARSPVPRHRVQAR